MIRYYVDGYIVSVHKKLPVRVEYDAKYIVNLTTGVVLKNRNDMSSVGKHFAVEEISGRAGKLVERTVIEIAPKQ